MSLLSPEVESTYEILEMMGEGGMGAVYKARHRVFADFCVIKVMQGHLIADPRSRERFENEARKGKQIDHPNIARVLNFFVGSNGNAHLVMEYIDGVNLHTVRARRGTALDPATVVTIGTQVLSALACLHERNLVHRDISPDNIMMLQDAGGAMRLKLIDLGIAKSLDVNTTPMTQAGSFIGKPPYAAPEQFGGEVDARSDLYSFGVVLYELSTGSRPITGTNVGSYAVAHHSVQPLPFAQSDPDGRVPDTLRSVILKALEKQPGRRYQTAAEFAAALRGQSFFDRTQSMEVPLVLPATVPVAPLPTPPVDAPVSVWPAPPPPPVIQPGPAPATWTPPATPQPRSPRKYWRYVTAALLLLLGGFVYAFRTSGELDNDDKLKLGGIIRNVVAEGREPSITDPSIAAFITTEKVKPEVVKPFAVEFAIKLRDAAKEIDKGKEAIARKDAQGAYSAFSEAKRIDPDNADAWTDFGGAAALLNKQSEATAAYQRALAIKPNHWIAHYNLGCLYARAGQMTDALDMVGLAMSEMRQQRTPVEARSILASVRRDEALKELWNDPRFTKIVAER
ncbi:MAG: protein kinase [Acidobacteriota bacterium]